MPRHRPTSAPDSSGENFGPELAAAEGYISDDDADDYPPFQPPGANATEDELRKVSCIDFLCVCLVSHLLLQALRNAQVIITGMRLDLRDLRVKATKLELRVKALTQNSHEAANQKDNLVTPASTQEDLIGLYAWKFGTMNEFYVPCAAFMVARPTGVRSDDPDRWDSEKLALRGLSCTKSSLLFSMSCWQDILRYVTG